ncbi:MAG: murein biosynthesis integral membrane protein MurJ [Actinobacteria bacterium]|nr:murein biosynthesis integral membrane protein MurJ [Actinomycetota bacterium]MBV9662611.1 murein biosynthesis integral membrane protein MurJ [Actinomycetota bacterium]MBV9934331.1 murein biosynthesis integral membrane protein MurJ [Actinomycetota bacterium]
MAVGTALSRITGFGRVFAMAYAFGFVRTRLTDTYNLANTTPNIIYDLVLGGVLSATLLPVFVHRLATDDEDGAWRSISAVVTVVVLFLVGVAALFAALAPWIVRAYTLGNHSADAGDQRAVATYLLLLFAPQVFFYGIVTLATAILHARRRFAMPMFAPIFNNLIVIAVLLLVPHVAHSLDLGVIRHDHKALLLLGLGTTAGVVAMAVVQLPPLRGAGARLRPVWAPRDDLVRVVLRLSGWTFGFSILNQIALWVALVLANRHTGDLSAYQAAYSYFFLLPYGIFAVSLMSALQPDLSERWALADVAGYRERLSVGIRTIAAVIVPASIGYIVLAKPIVKVLLQHGRFTAHDTHTTAAVLAVMATGLPAFSIFLLLMRAYQSMQDTRTVFWLYLVENGVNVVLALALYPSMRVNGLALSFSLAYVAGTLVALVHLRRRIGGVDGRRLVRSLARITVASTAMAAATLAVSHVVGGSEGLRLLIRVGLSVAVGLGVYGLAAVVLRMDEVTTLLPIRRRAS